MRKKRLSAEQAFAVMAIFLEKYYERGPANGDLAILLGDLQLNDQDGLPLDPAIWDDWLAAVNEVFEKSPDVQPAAAQC
jgi:hypothetical protein